MTDNITVNLQNGNRKFNIDFVLIKPGKYSIRNRPILRMKNSVVEYSERFWMQATTVSMGLYEFVYGKPYYENGLTEKENLLFPWHGMDFNEVVGFLNKLNEIANANSYHFIIDIPSITQWEHALLCGNDNIWSWGHDSQELVNYAWFGKNSGNKVHLSKQKKPNDWGLYDMYGNVHEYCYQSILDQSESYFLNPKIEKPKPDYVLPCMGGAYYSNEEDCCGYNVIGYRNEFIEPTGIRLIIRQASPLLRR